MAKKSLTQHTKDAIEKKIKERGRIKSTAIYNSIRKIGGNKVSDRTIGRCLKLLDGKDDVIKRTGHGNNTVCIYTGKDESKKVKHQNP